MNFELKIATKRKREEDVDSDGSYSRGNSVKGGGSSSSLRTDAADQSSADGKISIEIDAKAATALAACRTAFVKCPAASRAALITHRPFIDSDVVKLLETVGSYELNEYDTPLHESVRREDMATAQSLVAAGADVNASNLLEETPFSLAAHAGSSLRDFFEHHAAVLNFLGTDPAALVPAVVAHCAALSGLKDSVPAPKIQLSAHHLDPFFLWAPTGSRKGIFAWARNIFVIQFAANTTTFKDLPDDCAGDILEYLVTTMTRLETMLIMTNGFSPEAHDWALAVLKASVVAKVSDDLIIAARQNDVASVRDCLNKGANVDAPIAPVASTPLIEASTWGYDDIVKLLLKAGAYKDASKDHGSTALSMATRMGRTATVQLLLEAGVDPNRRDEHGSTALINAAAGARNAIVKLLLEAGADKDARAVGGCSALMHASRTGDVEAVKLLLQAGANEEFKDRRGNTALGLAQYSRRRKEVEALFSSQGASS